MSSTTMTPVYLYFSHISMMAGNTVVRHRAITRCLGARFVRSCVSSSSGPGVLSQ